MSHATVRQCHYCDNYFVKTEEKMNVHLSVCAARAGVTYSFDNGKIIDYQDNCKFMGDVPFSVYFDFETTKGSVLFFDAKMYVVSYCIIVAFHKELNLPKLAIFRSFDQGWEDLTGLDHFEAIEENIFRDDFLFNVVILKQLEVAAFGVKNREKTTSLAEMFGIELKFTIDTLKQWFDKRKKTKFLELDGEKKYDFKRRNPVTENTCVQFAIFRLSHVQREVGVITLFGRNTFFRTIFMISMK